MHACLFVFDSLVYRGVQVLAFVAVPAGRGPKSERSILEVDVEIENTKVHSHFCSRTFLDATCRIE